MSNPFRDPTFRGLLRALKEENRRLREAGDLDKAQEHSQKFLAEGEDLPTAEQEIRKSSGIMPPRR
jgi:hypothetical protein